MKLWKTFKVETISLYDFEGPLDKALVLLSSLPQEHPEYKDFEIQVHTYGDSTGELEIYAKRLETDKEYECRMKRITTAKTSAKSRKERQRQKELAEYERLKKKFGTNQVIPQGWHTSQPGDTLKSTGI